MHALDKVDQLMKMLLQMQPIPADRKNILDKKFRLEFNYNSNHIEGNTLTYGETELLLIFDDTKGNHQMREYEEMKAHDVAYKMVEEWAADRERPLTEQQIKNLNEIILVRPYWKDAVTNEGQATRRQIKIGDYKDMPNSVRLANGEMFHYASPAETPIQMQELIDWYRAEEDALHPVTLAAMLHYKFVRIHPFDDGNGRMARLLLNYVLLNNGYPPVVIKSADKTNYLQALHLADVGDMEAFIAYVAEQLVWSLEISIKAAKGESIDEPGDLNKKLAAFKKRIGQKENGRIKLRYGLKAFKSIYDGLSYLIKKWSEKIEEFDILFFSRKDLINVFDDTPFPYNFEGNNSDIYDEFNSIVKRILGDNLFRNIESIDERDNIIITRIEFSIAFENLRASRNRNTYNGGNLFISFYSNLYEIVIDEGKSIQKLYNEELSTNEITEIVESMGNRLFNTLEKEIEENT